MGATFADESYIEEFSCYFPRIVLNSHFLLISVELNFAWKFFLPECTYCFSFLLMKKYTELTKLKALVINNFEEWRYFWKIFPLNNPWQEFQNVFFFGWLCEYLLLLEKKTWEKNQNPDSEEFFLESTTQYFRLI